MAGNANTNLMMAMSMARQPAGGTPATPGGEEEIVEEPAEGGEGEKGSEAEGSLWRALALRDLGGSHRYGRDSSGMAPELHDRDDDIFEV